jgi:hypothetical protein
MSKPDPKKPVKAITAGIVYAAGWAATSLADGVVTAQEWWAGGIGLALALGAVYGFKNPQVPE